MAKYEDVVRLLGESESVCGCLSGEIPVPIFAAEIPAYWYGFPPALIPIWSEGSLPSYVGIWVHWFSDKKPSFVEMLVFSGGTTFEFARNSEQFFSVVIAKAIVEQDGVSQEIEDFSRLVGIENLDDIDAVTLVSGDDPVGLGGLASFKNNLPANSVNDASSYSGWFPMLTSDGDVLNLDGCYEFEIDEEMLQVAKRGGYDAPWLRGGARLDWFNKCLAEGNKEEAWQALNCKGWSILDARDAIKRLALYARDENFTALAEAWLSVADPQVGGY